MASPAIALVRAVRKKDAMINLRGPARPGGRAAGPGWRHDEHDGRGRDGCEDGAAAAGGRPEKRIMTDLRGPTRPDLSGAARNATTDATTNATTNARRPARDGIGTRRHRRATKKIDKTMRCGLGARREGETAKHCTAASGRDERGGQKSGRRREEKEKERAKEEKGKKMFSSFEIFFFSLAARARRNRNAAAPASHEKN